MHAEKLSRLVRPPPTHVVAGERQRGLVEGTILKNLLELAVNASRSAACWSPLLLAAVCLASAPAARVVVRLSTWM